MLNLLWEEQLDAAILGRSESRRPGKLVSRYAQDCRFPAVRRTPDTICPT